MQRVRGLCDRLYMSWECLVAVTSTTQCVICSLETYANAHHATNYHLWKTSSGAGEHTLDGAWLSNNLDKRDEVTQVSYGRLSRTCEHNNAFNAAN